MEFLVVLVMAVIVVAFVVSAVRAGFAADEAESDGRPSPPRPRTAHVARPLGPDDDPEFLRQLERRLHRGDGSPA